MIENKMVQSIYGKLSYVEIMNSFNETTTGACIDVWLNRLKERGIVELTDADIEGILTLNYSRNDKLCEDAMEFAIDCSKHQKECTCDDCYKQYGGLL